MQEKVYTFRRRLWKCAWQSLRRIGNSSIKFNLFKTWNSLVTPTALPRKKTFLNLQAQTKRTIWYSDWWCWLHMTFLLRMKKSNPETSMVGLISFGGDDYSESLYWILPHEGPEAPKSIEEQSSRKCDRRSSGVRCLGTTLLSELYTSTVSSGVREPHAKVDFHVHSLTGRTSTLAWGNVYF